jgi:hypothetical protein
MIDCGSEPVSPLSSAPRQANERAMRIGKSPLFARTSMLES